MPQLVKGHIVAKTPAEFEYHGLRGTPYCAIYKTMNHPDGGISLRPLTPHFSHPYRSTSNTLNPLFPKQ